jgi:Xaa-Pro aminopeptidase
MNTGFTERRSALVQKFGALHVESLLVTHPADWYYLTGFTGESGALVVTRREATLITDGRFAGQAKAEARGVAVVQQKGSLFESTGEFLAGSKAKSVGFEATQLSVSQYRVLRRAAERGCKWKPVAGLVADLRMHKDAQELAVIEYQIRKRGASGAAFETIVAFGERAALPHARPTAKRLKKNEFVVLDLGVILAHYCSDITRTFYYGKAPERVRQWYKAVQDAQVAAIAAVKNGVLCGDVDAAARQVLERQGLGKYFVHSTGHGLGLEVHEDPRIARGQKKRLQAGNVVTIEPGIYIEGVGGIRIEDDVAVHANRIEVLTRITRDLIEL